MMKLILGIILCCTIAAAALKIHDYDHLHHGHEYEHLEQAKYEPAHEETEHHHEIDHKHATSHQSVKFHHYHAVPVYIKKEDQHLLKSPIEIGGSKQKLKVLHPETQHHHNHGLVLENHSESHGIHEYEHHEEPQHYEHYHHE